MSFPKRFTQNEPRGVDVSLKSIKKIYTPY